MLSTLSFQYLDRFRKTHIGLKLLQADHFALIVSFFHRVFIAKNSRTISYEGIVVELDHYLSELIDELGEIRFPKAAKAYIDDWTSDKTPYLRKYYPLEKEKTEPEVDMAPEVETVIQWILGLEKREFVGTESRLKFVLNLVLEIVQGTNEDKQSLLDNLAAQKNAIEEKIQQVTDGQFVGLTSTELKERLYLVSDLSQQLLGDFRQVEANFRSLDRLFRKTISQQATAKGIILDEVLKEQADINERDEGRSFNAFFEMLMKPSMRETLGRHLQELVSLDEFTSLKDWQREQLLRLYRRLLEAGGKVNSTKNQITEQLRKFVQEQKDQDNKRTMELIKKIQQQLHQLDTLPEADPFAELRGNKADINPVFSQTLFCHKEEEAFEIAAVNIDDDETADLSDLFESSLVDEAELEAKIFKSMSDMPQIKLADVIEDYPLRYGLEELAIYLKLATEQKVHCVIEEERTTPIVWVGENGKKKTARLPDIIFMKD